MYKFPNSLYSDVRIEDVFETNISFTKGKINKNSVTRYQAAFIRIFNGERWYYTSTSDVDNIQKEIDYLASKARTNEGIYNHPIVRKFEVNKGKFLRFEADDVTKVNKEEKKKLITDLFNVIEFREVIKTWGAAYIENKKIQHFFSSKGADIVFDSQRVGIGIRVALEQDGKNLSETFMKSSDKFDDLKNQKINLEKFISKCENFMKNSRSVVPGKYKVILSPFAAGVFAHESFGHKSEADFMVEDDTMKEEWAIGKKIGADILSIVDYGMGVGSGYVPFDDEGTKSKETYLIENGILKGRLHSASTAVSLDEDLTGNCRAVNFEYEPIVRMTSTYILPGDKTKEELFYEVKDGIYIDTIKHGSGMSTFTIAPSIAYLIKDGKITDPVSISTITGNVFETLSDVDGVSDELELLSLVAFHCGKNDQMGLPVGLGGPYVRVKDMNVQ